MSRTILLTGFQPFDGEPVNAAWELVQTFTDYRHSGGSVIVRQLPTVFGESSRVLRSYLDEIDPDDVICLGQAGGRAAISLERVGVNLDDARIPDNAGQTPMDQAIDAAGPAAYFSTLPLRELKNRLLAAGVPVEISMTAGTFVCNHVLYSLLRALDVRGAIGKATRAGFIHVPFLPEQAARNNNAPSLSLETLRRGLEEVLRHLFEYSA